MNALARGLETTASLQVLPRWQLHASHAYHWKELTFDPGSTDPTGGASEANDPRNIFKLRSYVTADEPHRDRRLLSAMSASCRSRPSTPTTSSTRVSDIASGPDGTCR